jgi:ABC-type antimicrobial peptide transport system permease subunit
LLRQLVSYGGRRFLLGTTLGIGLSVAMARTMTSLVEGARMPGVATYLLVTAVVGLVAVLAFLSPALRVLHTDPGRVLRDD